MAAKGPRYEGDGGGGGGGWSWAHWRSDDRRDVEAGKAAPRHSEGKVSEIEAGKPPGEGPPPVTAPDPEVIPPNSGA